MVSSPSREGRPPNPDLGRAPTVSQTASFTAVVSRSLAAPMVDVKVKKVSSHFGEPAVFFSQAEVDRSESAFSTALVAKCSYGRPSLFSIKDFLQKTLFLQGDIIVSLLDARHVLLRLTTQVNFVKVWMKGLVHVQGFLLRFMKWTSGFVSGWELPFAPIWISLPRLPVNFYQGNFLVSIAGVVGRVLKIDSATINCTHTVAARVCVEVDLRAPLPSRVWIGCGVDGFHQKVLYEGLPSYCVSCSKLGHVKEACRKAQRVKSGAVRGDVGEAGLAQVIPIERDAAFEGAGSRDKEGVFIPTGEGSSREGPTATRRVAGKGMARRGGHWRPTARRAVVGVAGGAHGETTDRGLILEQPGSILAAGSLAEERQLAVVEEEFVARQGVGVGVSAGCRAAGSSLFSSSSPEGNRGGGLGVSNVGPGASTAASLDRLPNALLAQLDSGLATNTLGRRSRSVNVASQHYFEGG
ncbi:uncharacterized protein LOC122652044 [Telopea speciosissima]|uniref:uncharacterized protein LOC122652044 n=1 Tax=Telopea speciosissima TaxID=54955 RepID=UPI001CC42BF1|nr:uncharacterized protein LOC122652044 [Telopea speciosissima]